jgi:hypothetical protein
MKEEIDGCYYVLGIEKTATIQIINAQYDKLKLRHEFDEKSNLPEHIKKISKSIFEIIKNCYNNLIQELKKNKKINKKINKKTNKQNINIKSKIKDFNIIKFNIFKGMPLKTNDKSKIIAYYKNLVPIEQQKFNLIIFINNIDQIRALIDKINRNPEKINLNLFLYYSFSGNMCQGDINCERILDEIFIINKKITNDVSKKIYNIYISNIYKNIKNILFNFAEDIKVKSIQGKTVKDKKLINLMSEIKQQIIDIINKK